MSQYFKTVGDIRKALEGYSDEFPVDFYVDSDALERQHDNWPVLVNTVEVEYTDEEMAEMKEAAATGNATRWSRQEMEPPKVFLQFLVG